MLSITVTTTIWRAKHGGDAMRIVRLDGQRCRHAACPTIILRLSGLTGYRTRAPVERTSLDIPSRTSATAALYYELDRDWTIQSETSLEVDEEGTLRRLLGRSGMALIGPDAYPFLASWYPVCISKEVSRSYDGLETRRVVRIENRNGADLTITAIKRAGRSESFDAKWGADRPDPIFGILSGSLRGEGLKRLDVRHRVNCWDEASLHACLGPALLGWMRPRDYSRFVWRGCLTGFEPSEVWGDGYDRGGNGPPHPPVARPTAAPTPTTTQVGDASGGVPRLTPVNVPAARLAAEDADDPAYRDDPSYGLF